MIVVNFKNYKTGTEILKLTKEIEKYDKKVIVAVPSVYLKLISLKTKLKVFAQHIDSEEGKKATGFVLAESVKDAGAEGTLLNHSEHRLKEEEIKKTIKKAKRVGLKVVLCVKKPDETEKYKNLKPYGIAFEDSNLISTGKSIVNYKSDSVKKFAKILWKTKIVPFCGAGISSMDDYKASLKLGCKGVLVSSAIANSDSGAKRFFKNAEF